MKKFILFITASAFIQFTGCSKDNTAQNDGIINFMTGDVQIITEGKPAPANVGDKIIQGMIIKTGPKSIAEIRFNSSTIRINEKSAIEIRQLVRDASKNKESSEFYVDNGKVLFNVTKKLMKDDKFRVETPTAVAAVRGTEFQVSVEKNKSIITCISGTVEVKEAASDDSTFTKVEAGKEVIIEKTGASSAGDKKTGTDKNIKTDPAVSLPKLKGPSMIRAEAVKGDIEDKN